MKYSQNQVLDIVIDYMQGTPSKSIAKKHKIGSGKLVATLMSDLRKKGHDIPYRRRPQLAW